MNEEQKPPISPFETIRQLAEDGSEYWSARDLAKILDYSLWQKFRNVIKKAELACLNSDQVVADHFIHTDKMVELGSGARRKIEDIYLSRYGCYLIVQNADPSKEIVALGQTYFAVQTRRQEQADELAGLAEDQRRLYLRGQLTDHNRQLAQTASDAGVVQSRYFSIFQDHGYMGLYGGLRAREIHAHKKLKQKQKILDHMGSEELAANLFRATQTGAKLRREQIQGKELANQTHFEMGQKVRVFIQDVGGTMPEDLPTPSSGIKEVQQKEKKRLQQNPQLGLFKEISENE